MAAAVERPTRFTFPTLFSRFYGSALPRPYIFETGDKPRVDPPRINKALLDWAAEAHWSMGGWNMDRKKLQGKIEGNLDKLDKQGRKRASTSEEEPSAKRRKKDADSKDDDGAPSENETDAEAESDPELESESEEAPEETEDEDEDERSQLLTRTRSGSRRAKEKLRKNLFDNYADEQTQPSAPAGSSRARQLRKVSAVVPKSKTPSTTRLGGRSRTPVSAKSDAKGPVREAARVTPVNLPSASGEESDRESDEEKDEAEDGDEYTESESDEELEEREDAEEYPATDEEEGGEEDDY